METQVWDCVLEMGWGWRTGTGETGDRDSGLWSWGGGGPSDGDPGPGLGDQSGWREWRPGQRFEDLGTEAQAQDWRRSRTLYLSLI